MKQWLRRKLISFLNQEDVCESISISLDDEIDNNWPDPITFKIQKAHGGTIIEARYYDRKTDERYNVIHVVSDEQDLQSSIAKIITFESLKK